MEGDRFPNNSLNEVRANMTNRLLCGFLVIGLFFGVLFYDFIDTNLHFSYIDEVLALILSLFTLFSFVHVRQVKIESYWFWLFGIFLFYIIYSFLIHSNASSAILQDAVVEIKPFLGFFCAYTIAVELTSGQKKIIRYACFFAMFCLLLTTPKMHYFLGHPSRYATAATFIAMLYLFVSDFTKRNLVVFILMLFVAVFSAKAKAFGFVALAGIFSIFYYKDIRFKFSLKSVIISLVVLALVVVVAWQKIYFYFIYGAQNMSSNELEDAFARPAMYWGAWQVLFDYFPFGSGFSSYGTFFSAKYYSDIYYVYSLNMIQGITDQDPAFIADAYYPSLAQYGIAGFLIFFYFWFYVIKNAVKYRFHEGLESAKFVLIILLIVAFFGIELIADTTLTHNRGFFMMVLMGLSLRLLRDRYSNIELE
ncbi:MAG: putative rane protein [Bacteroidetes bacterium]|nr:putative rane protein [Bacteroidota bacterium]